MTPDESFTGADSNSFLSLWEIIPSSRKQIFREILEEFLYFIMKLNVSCTHYNRLIEASLMSELHIPLFYVLHYFITKSKRHP